MTRTITRRVISSIMAFALVCAMMLCGTTVFAAEISDTAEEATIETMATARGTVYSSSQWNFKQQKDTNSFSANAGQTVSFNMGSLSSTSEKGFDVKLCRMVGDTPQVVSGPIHVESNRSYGSTITFNIYTNGTYIVRCDRTNDGASQIINSVSVYVGD